MKPELRNKLTVAGQNFFSEFGADRISVRTVGAFRSELVRGVLADFILQRRDLGKDCRCALLIHMKQLSPSAEKLVQEYSEQHDPQLRCLVVDDAGNGYLWREGVGQRVKLPAAPVTISKASYRRSSGSLFSPNNQWLWKVLLLGGLESQYWGGPSSENTVDGISRLAEVAGKPQPSVSRFVQLAESENYLVREGRRLRVQRIPELLEQWAYFQLNEPDSALSVCSLYPGEDLDDILPRMREAGAVLGGHAAADALHLSISNVRRGHLYVRDFDRACQELEVAECGPSEESFRLVYPKAEEAIFHAATKGVQGSAVCDVLQVYLDVYLDPARGREQADHIFEKVLAPHWDKRQCH